MRGPRGGCGGRRCGLPATTGKERLDARQFFSELVDGNASPPFARVFTSSPSRARPADGPVAAELRVEHLDDERLPRLDVARAAEDRVLEAVVEGHGSALDVAPGRVRVAGLEEDARAVAPALAGAAAVAEREEVPQPQVVGAGVGQHRRARFQAPELRPHDPRVPRALFGLF